MSWKEGLQRKMNLRILESERDWAGPLKHLGFSYVDTWNAEEKGV